MRIAVASDHAGYELKTALAAHLTGQGHEVADLGCDSADAPVDYPWFGIAVGRAVAEGRADRGVCVCGTGIGISISANKVQGIRAALVHDVTSAALARRHNDANVVCLGGRTTGRVVALEAVDAFFSTAFEGGRYLHRVSEIAAFERDPASRAPSPAPASSVAAAGAPAGRGAAADGRPVEVRT